MPILKRTFSYFQKLLGLASSYFSYLNSTFFLSQIQEDHLRYLHVVSLMREMICSKRDPEKGHRKSSVLSQ